MRNRLEGPGEVLFRKAIAVGCYEPPVVLKHWPRETPIPFILPIKVLVLDLGCFHGDIGTMGKCTGIRCDGAIFICNIIGRTVTRAIDYIIGPGVIVLEVADKY